MRQPFSIYKVKYDPRSIAFIKIFVLFIDWFIALK